MMETSTLKDFLNFQSSAIELPARRETLGRQRGELLSRILEERLIYDGIFLSDPTPVLVRQVYVARLCRHLRCALEAVLLRSTTSSKEVTQLGSDTPLLSVQVVNDFSLAVDVLVCLGMYPYYKAGVGVPFEQRAPIFNKHFGSKGGNILRTSELVVDDPRSPTATLTMTAAVQAVLALTKAEQLRTVVGPRVADLCAAYHQLLELHYTEKEIEGAEAHGATAPASNKAVESVSAAEAIRRYPVGANASPATVINQLQEMRFGGEAAHGDSEVSLVEKGVNSVGVSATDPRSRRNDETIADALVVVEAQYRIASVFVEKENPGCGEACSSESILEDGIRSGKDRVGLWLNLKKTLSRQYQDALDSLPLHASFEGYLTVHGACHSLPPELVARLPPKAPRFIRCPPWLRAVCGRRLSQLLAMEGGVFTLLSALLGDADPGDPRPIEVAADLVGVYAQHRRAYASPDEYFATVGPQLIHLLLHEGSGVKPAVVRTCLMSILKAIQRTPSAARAHLLFPLVAPLARVADIDPQKSSGAAPQVIVSEKELLIHLKTIRSLFRALSLNLASPSSSTPSQSSSSSSQPMSSSPGPPRTSTSTKPSQSTPTKSPDMLVCPDPTAPVLDVVEGVLPVLYGLYCFAARGVSSVKGLCRDLLVEFFRRSEHTVPLLKELLCPMSSGNRHSGELSVSALKSPHATTAQRVWQNFRLLKFVPGESGGIDVTFDTNHSAGAGDLSELATLMSGGLCSSLPGDPAAAAAIVEELPHVLGLLKALGPAHEGVVATLFVELLDDYVRETLRTADDGGDADGAIVGATLDGRSKSVEHALEGTRRQIRLAMVLLHLSENLSESAFKKIGRIIRLVTSLFTVSSVDEETTLLCLQLLHGGLAAGAKLKETDVSCVSDLLPILSTIAAAESPHELSDTSHDIKGLARAVYDKLQEAVNRLTRRKSKQKLSPQMDGVKSPSHSSGSLLSALRDIRSELIPIRGHGLVCLRTLVLARDDATWHSIDQVVEIALTQLKDEESYVYLNAVYVLAAIAEISPARMVRKVATLFLDDSLAVPTRVKVGEAVVLVMYKLGEAFSKYGDCLVNALLQCCRDPSSSPSPNAKRPNAAVPATSAASSSSSSSSSSNHFLSTKSTHVAPRTVMNNATPSTTATHTFATSPASPSHSPLSFLRASSVSLLGTACTHLGAALWPYATDMAISFTCLLATDSDQDVRRACAYAAVQLIRVAHSLGASSLVSFVGTDAMESLLSRLRLASESDPDLITRAHAAHALSEVAEVVTSSLRVEDDVSLGASISPLHEKAAADAQHAKFVLDIEGLGTGVAHVPSIARDIRRELRFIDSAARAL